MAGAAPLNTEARVGVIFFAHGSRDPLWRQPIEAVAHALKSRYPQALCACAYLELTEPDLPTAAKQLIEQGCTQLTILPMFLGTGRHARNDLPLLVDGLRQQHPEVQFDTATAVGEDPRVTELLAVIAAQHIA